LRDDQNIQGSKIVNNFFKKNKIFLVPTSDPVGAWPANQAGKSLGWRLEKNRPGITPSFATGEDREVLSAKGRIDSVSEWGLPRHWHANPSFSTGRKTALLEGAERLDPA